MNLKTIVASTVISVAAFAGSTPAPAPVQTVPTLRPPIAEPAMSCPTGTRQAGGQNSTKEASFCVRLDENGSPVIHGPYLALHPNGKKAVMGQYENGKRTGLWTTFDAAGGKVEEVTFVNDLYEGLRTQWMNGKKSIEETYVAGKKQGAQRTWDAAGKVTITQFVNDRPVAK